MDPPAAPALPCPGCHGPLALELAPSADGHGVRHYPCPGCGGLMCSIAVFRTVAGAERGAREWAAAMDPANTSAGGGCPFCGLAMRAAPVEHGRVWACRTCEMAWADKEALASFAGGAGGAAAPGAGAVEAAAAAEGAATELRCENCGAPVQHTWDERCEYCGAALHAPTKVVVVDGLGSRAASPAGESVTAQLVDRLLGR